MWSERISFVTVTVSTRKAGRALKAGLFLIWMAFNLTACAQQSELMKVEKDLGGKITELDQGKKALGLGLEQVNQDIADARAAFEQQKAELNKEIVKARAEIRSRLQSLEREDLPKVQGDLETHSHRLDEADRRADALEDAVSTLKELREQRDAQLSERITDLGKRFEADRKNLEDALKQRDQKVRDQFAAFQDSLVQFKEALAGVDKRLADERKRATSAETKLRQAVDKRLQVFQAKLDSDTQALKTYLETDVKTAIESINAVLNEGNRNLKADIDAQATQLSELNAKLGTELAGLRRTDTLHGKKLEEVILSLAQLRDVFDVLRTTGTQLGTELDGQGRELEQTANRIERLQGQYAALAKKLDADVKSLHGYLDKDVRSSLKSIAKAFDQEKNRVSQEFIKVKSGLQRVEQTNASNVTQAQKRLDTQGENVQKLRDAVTGMREVLDSMAGTLGNRTDQNVNQLGQLTARMERVEKEQSAEAAKQASNTQAVSTYLDEVTASVQSVGQSFEQFKNVVSSRLNEQANRLHDQAQQASKSASALPGLQEGLKASVTQMNALTESVAQLKEVVSAMGEKLGSKVDTHESQLIAADKARKHSIDEVTVNVQSIGQSFEQFKNVVSSRLNEQANRLHDQAQQASKSASALPGLQEGLKASVTQMNALTESVAQLKEVVSAMGEKLGSKVDTHESQLIAADKARKHSIDEVTANVQSIGQSFEQFKNMVSSRLNEQADRLQDQAQQASKSRGAVSVVPSLQDGLKASVTQLNALTESVAQLKEVVSVMGAKLGSKVDAHESQLIAVEQALKQFEQPARSESRVP